MRTNKSGVEHSQCNPRRLKNKLDQFLLDHNLSITTKRQRILALLVCTSSCKCKITRFDAEWFGDHCLNTTISEIRRLDCIEVKRNDTKRPTRFGTRVTCKEYWLDREALYQAKSILGVMK